MGRGQLTEPLSDDVRALARAAQGDMDVLALCDGTAEGILTAVGSAYLARVPAARVRIAAKELAQPSLTERVVGVATDERLADRVMAGFLRATCPSGRRPGLPRYVHSMTSMVALVAANVDDPSMAEALHRYLRAGFTWGWHVGEHNSDPRVAPAERLATEAAAEAERARQFVRFSRLGDGTFFSEFRPKADVVPLVAGHFKRRMEGERFCIVDPAHGSMALGDLGRLGLVRLEPQEAARICEAAKGAEDRDEPYVRALWKRFYDALELPDRGVEGRGYDLRGTFMPKRLWSGLPELDRATDTAWTWVPDRYRDACGPRIEGASGTGAVGLPAGS